MKSFFTAFLFFILYAATSFLYLSFFMPFNEVFFVSFITLLALGMIVTYAAKFCAVTYSSLFVSTALLSIVIGSIAAALVIVCGRIVFGDIAPPRSLDVLLRFLLPFTTTILSYWSIKSLLASLSRNSSAITAMGNPEEHRGGKFFLPDVDALEDGRIVDLARTGLFDGQIVVPTFLQKEVRALSESPEDVYKQRGRKALESLRRLEAFQKISTKVKDISVPDVGNFADKLVRAARAIDATIITSEFSPLRLDAEPGLYLAIDSIANALRPPIPKGEFLPIKIQRLGKEPKQGIGYLDDGTMVVVNGGGDHLGKTVRTQVLSQKYSSSGKIVFCNVREEGFEDKVPCLNFSTSTL